MIQEHKSSGITVKIFPSIAELINSPAELIEKRYEICDSVTTVYDVLKKLVSTGGELYRQEIFDPDKEKFGGEALVTLNGEFIFESNVHTKFMHEGDELSIVKMSYGG